MDIVAEFRLPACVKKKGDWFVSSCPPLDVFSQGRTDEEALKNLVEALVEFFLSCFERGTLNQVLSEAGFMPIPGTPEEIVVASQRPVSCPPEAGEVRELRVPLPFIIADRTRDQHAGH